MVRRGQLMCFVAMLFVIGRVELLQEREGGGGRGALTRHAPTLVHAPPPVGGRGRTRRDINKTFPCLRALADFFCLSLFIPPSFLLVATATGFFPQAPTAPALGVESCRGFSLLQSGRGKNLPPPPPAPIFFFFFSFCLSFFS